MAMRIGAEDKKKLAGASVLGILAIILVVHTVWDLMSGPSTPAPVVAVRPAAPSANRTNPPTMQPTQPGQAQKLESATELDPTLHPERMLFAETTQYTGNGRNIFSKNSLPPPPPISNIEKPIASARTGVVAPQGPPPPPPIDLKFYGFATEQNGRKTVFLLHGEDVFVAGEGDIVNRRFRVVQILPKAVVVEDLSYNDKQTLPLQDN
jgi:hypothetical protein